MRTQFHRIAPPQLCLLLVLAIGVYTKTTRAVEGSNGPQSRGDFLMADDSTAAFTLDELRQKINRFVLMTIPRRSIFSSASRRPRTCRVTRPGS